jgi:hypothetical protein
MARNTRLIWNQRSNVFVNKENPAMAMPPFGGWENSDPVC